MRSAGFWIALVSAGSFSALASFAWGRVETHWAVSSGYSIAERAAVERLIPAAEARDVVLRKPSKKHELSRRQAEAYAFVYGITEENMDSYERWW